jgi:hypothetical protein
MRWHCKQRVHILFFFIFCDFFKLLIFCANKTNFTLQDFKLIALQYSQYYLTGEKEDVEYQGKENNFLKLVKWVV